MTDDGRNKKSNILDYFEIIRVDINITKHKVVNSYIYL